MIYIICPVRKISEEQKIEIAEYIEALINQGKEVHSYLNVEQEDTTGFNIVMSHKEAMQKCNEVHIFWDSSSTGSHVDLGMALALDKKIKLIKSYREDTEGKSYFKVIKILNEM
jgi:hypothetical protein